MPIFYTSIFYKETKILCEVTDFFGNLQQACRSLVKVIKKDYKGTFSYEDKYYFHYIDDKGITFICLSDNDYPIEIAHYYLFQIKELLLENFSENQIKISDTLGIESILKGKIQQKQEFFNQDYNSLEQIKQKLLIEDNKYSSIISNEDNKDKIKKRESFIEIDPKITNDINLNNNKNFLFNVNNKPNNKFIKKTTNSTPSDFSNSSFYQEAFLNDDEGKNTPAVVFLAASLNEVS